MSHPVPLVPADQLWLSHGVDIATAISAALTPGLEARRFKLAELVTSQNRLICAQAVFHDIKTLLRESDGTTTLWGLARGHHHARIVGLARRRAEPYGVAIDLGVPRLASNFRVFTLHRHLCDDWPDVTALYADAITCALPGWEISVDDDKLSELQAEADALLRRGLLPAAVDVASFARASQVTSANLCAFA